MRCDSIQIRFLLFWGCTLNFLAILGQGNVQQDNNPSRNNPSSTNQLLYLFPTFSQVQVGRVFMSVANWSIQVEDNGREQEQLTSTVSVSKTYNGKPLPYVTTYGTLLHLYDELNLGWFYFQP